MHDFYLFTRSLDCTELEAARGRALAADPDLVTRSGLAYRSFVRLLAAQQKQAADANRRPTAANRRAVRRTSTGRLIVTSVDVANPDPHAMARLLLAMARDQAKETDH